MQLVAQSVGTGLGLLLRSTAAAMIGTIVLPLGVWLILGAFAALRPALAWLTPFAAAPILLTGRMVPLNWARLLVIVSIWGIGLNAAGASRIRRSTVVGEWTIGVRSPSVRSDSGPGRRQHGCRPLRCIV